MCFHFTKSLCFSPQPSSRGMSAMFHVPVDEIIMIVHILKLG
jgi:hypothetical protein